MAMKNGTGMYWAFKLFCIFVPTVLDGSFDPQSKRETGANPVQSRCCKPCIIASRYTTVS